MRHTQIFSAATFLLAALPSFGAVLTFDGNVCSANSLGTGPNVLCVDGSTFNQGYGDSPTTDLTYTMAASSAGSLAAQSADGKKYYSAPFIDGALYRASIVLTALNGSLASVISFDIQASPIVGRSVAVVIRDLATNQQLYAYDLQTLTAGSGIHITPVGVSSRNGLTINYFDTQQVNGLDNLNFGGGTLNQVANPEPGTLLLTGLAFAGVGLLRRKRR